MTVVIGTAGHIDHGKTTLLAALTGTNADRLPEERRRGLTIDVGYAHASPDGGPEVDFVDVPGHDKLVGNMLVGAGEIDAAMVVVAANDGPRAQTWEHLALLDALGITAGVIVITKADLVDEARVADVVAVVHGALSQTSLAGAPIVAVSAQTGRGIDGLRTAIAALRDQVVAGSLAVRPREVWLAVDRAFSSRGHGLVVTGSSRGRRIRTDESLRVLPDGVSLRVRGLQVHDAVVAQGPLGGRVAVNLAGDRSADLRRGQLLVSGDVDRDPLAAVASDRLLVVLLRPASLPGRSDVARWPPADGAAARLHIGTDQADAVVGRSGREDVELDDDTCVAMLRLDRVVAVAIGHRFVLRRPAPAGLLAGGRVLDAAPARGKSRRRQDRPRLLALAAAIDTADQSAILDALLGLRGQLRSGDALRLAADVRIRAAAATIEAVRAYHHAHPDRAVMSLPSVRSAAAAAVRVGVSISEDDAAGAGRALVDELLSDALLLREGDGVRTLEHTSPTRDPGLDASMSRLEVALDVVAPPPLAQIAAQVGCPADGIRELERAGRIVIVDDDLAWSAAAYERLRASALSLARTAPLTPAALRDATGTSRKYVMALLEDFARRGILTRTPAGHIPGPRAMGPELAPNDGRR